MVDFRLSPAEETLIKDLNAFVDAELVPLHAKHQARFERDSEYLEPDGRVRTELVLAANELRRRSAKAGFYAMHMPEEVGGRGASYAALLRANEAVFTHGLGFTLAVLASIEGPGHMLLALNPNQRRRFLDPLIRGEKTTCFALTEPGAGSDVRAIQGRAVREGDEWVLNGTKKFITNGPYADFAQVFMRTGDAGGLDDITCFLVEKGTRGFTVGPVIETVADNGLPCELTFEDCRIPAENVVGEVGQGFLLALQNINDTRMQNAGMALGLAQYCLSRALTYAQDRHAFGRPIAKFQGVSFPLADCATDLQAARALATYAAWKIDMGEDAIAETSMTKLYATEMLWNVADRCLQVHGAIGTTRGVGIERILRWARVMRIWEGSSEIQRATIAKTLGL
ncbi:MAG: acyl-CoA dehydrogenase family protein [Thermoplasmatota archaeon]